jgi:hypothetical protein
MARIPATPPKGAHPPEPFHSTPGTPSPENTKLPLHAHSASDTHRFANLQPHIAPHSILGEVSAACNHLNTAEGGLFAALLALSGGPQTKIGHALMQNAKQLSGANLADLPLNALAQTLLEEGYKPK